MNKGYNASDEVVDKTIEKYMEQNNQNSGSGTQINNQAHTQNIANQIGTLNVLLDQKAETPKINIEGVRFVNQNLKLIIDKYRQPTNESASVNFRNGILNTPNNVETIPVKWLKFRKANGRIGIDVESYEKKNNIVLNEEDDNTQELLRHFLTIKDAKKNKELEDILSNEIQRDPAIITCDGSLINGNRRKMVFDKLYKTTHQDKFEYMNVIILPDDTTELEIRRIENKLQTQSDGKAEYKGIARALLMKRNEEIGFSVEAQLRDDARYAGMNAKDFAKALKEIHDEFLNPLLCIDRYLYTFDKDGYDSISESDGEFEGRWEAFKTYSKLYYGTFKNEKERAKLNPKIESDEVGDIENAVFKIIRKKRLVYDNSEKSGRLNDHLRKIKDYLNDANSKKHILNIAKEVEEDIPENDKYDETGNKYDEQIIDKKWGNLFNRQIVGNLQQAEGILGVKTDRNKPLDLLEDALGKLNNSNLIISDMDTGLFEQALKITDAIIDRAAELKKQIDTERYKYKKLKDKKN